MQTQNRTGYEFIYEHNGKYGVSVARKDARFRKDGLWSLYDAVKTLNESGFAKHAIPESPYDMLDAFLQKHRAPSTESATFATVYDRLRGPWRHIAKAPLSKHQLSKMLRARGFQIFKSGSNLKIRGLTL